MVSVGINSLLIIIQWSILLTFLDKMFNSYYPSCKNQEFTWSIEVAFDGEVSHLG